MKAEERNKARIKVLNRWTIMNAENYKNKRKKAKKMCTAKKNPITLRCWEVWRKQIKEMKTCSSQDEGWFPAINMFIIE